MGKVGHMTVRKMGRKMKVMQRKVRKRKVKVMLRKVVLAVRRMEKDNYIKHASSKDTLTEESESETDGESVVDLGNYKKDIPVVKLEASETEDSESDSPSSANDSGIESDDS